jgi:hypothetical protein
MADDRKPGAFASLLDGFGPVQRIFLFCGFIVCVMGVPSGFALQNRTLMIGTALFTAGIAGHYWPELRTLGVYVDGQSVRGEFLWGNFFLATAFSIFCATACWYAYLGH